MTEATAARFVARDGAGWRFQYDVQLNNARTVDVVVVARRWEVAPRRAVDALFTEDAAGAGGDRALGETRIAPGEAIRVQGTWTAPAREAVARGMFLVRTTDTTTGADVELWAHVGALALAADGESLDEDEFPASAWLYDVEGT